MLLLKVEFKVKQYLFWSFWLSGGSNIVWFLFLHRVWLLDWWLECNIQHSRSTWKRIILNDHWLNSIMLCVICVNFWSRLLPGSAGAILCWGQGAQTPSSCCSRPPVSFNGLSRWNWIVCNRVGVRTRPSEFLARTVPGEASFRVQVISRRLLTNKWVIYERNIIVPSWWYNDNCLQLYLNFLSCRSRVSLTCKLWTV